MALIESISPAWVLTAIGMAVAWITTVMAFAFRIGRFEGTVMKRIGDVEASSLENREAIKDVGNGIRNAETSLRQEIKDTRDSVNRRVDEVYKEILRKP